MHTEEDVPLERRLQERRQRVETKHRKELHDKGIYIMPTAPSLAPVQIPPGTVAAQTSSSATPSFPTTQPVELKSTPKPATVDSSSAASGDGAATERSETSPETQNNHNKNDDAAESRASPATGAASHSDGEPETEESSKAKKDAPEQNTAVVDGNDEKTSDTSREDRTQSPNTGGDASETNPKQSKSAAAAPTESARTDGLGETQKHYEAQPRMTPAARAQLSRHAAAIMRAEAEARMTELYLESSNEERERRIKENDRVRERVERLTAEAKQSMELQGAMAIRHEKLYTLTIPHELKAALDEQRAACDEIITAKDAIIASLKEETKEKDVSYTDGLTKHSEDLDRMLQEMRLQTEKLREMHDKKLEEVEDVYMSERKEQLDKCSKDLLQLVKQRRTRETEYRKGREARLVAAQTRLEEHHDSNYEAYNTHAVTGENETHALVQELERCKADFLLNAERLDYNLQVLRERVKENKLAQNQYKRKLGHMQDVLSALVAKYSESEKKFQKSNRELTEQLKRVTRQYQETQEKFQFFEKGELDKYNQIWKMHRSRCLNLINNCLVGDRVIHEEVLRVPWSPPPVEQWEAALAAGGDSFDDGLSSPSETAKRREGGGIVDEPADDMLDEIQLNDEEAIILQILYQQAPFLIEDKVRAVISMLGDPEQSNEVALEAVMHALGITKTKQIHELSRHFMVEQNDGSGEVALVHPQEAVRALTAFLQSRQDDLDATNNSGNSVSDYADGLNSNAKKADRTTGESTTMTMSGEPQTTWRSKTETVERKRRQRESEYWEQLANVVPASHLRTWDSAERGLQKYLVQLQLRERLVQETQSIRKENISLRDLLAEYLGSAINDDLYFPPQLNVDEQNQNVSIQSRMR